MTRVAKLLAALRCNPRGDWRIEDLKLIAGRFGSPHRQPGTSHVTSPPPAGPNVTLAATLLAEGLGYRRGRGSSRTQIAAQNSR